VSEPTIGIGEPIDPATAPALCVACYLGEHGRCGAPCNCTHDGPPAPRDGRYVQDECGVWWPRGDVGPRVETAIPERFLLVLDNESGRFTPRRPARSIFDDPGNAAMWAMLRRVLTARGYRQQVTRVQRWSRDDEACRMHQDYRRRQLARRRRGRRS
jgi:hypothetical protein